MANIEKVLESISKILKHQGEYLISLGQMSKEDKDFVEFINRAKNDPEFLSKILVELPADISNGILNILMQLLVISNKTSNTDSLSPDEKINVGTKLKKIAQELERLFATIKEIKRLKNEKEK